MKDHVLRGEALARGSGGWGGSASPDDVPTRVHGLRGLESWIGGNEVRGLTDLTGMIGLLTAIGLGMRVGAALGTKIFRRSSHTELLPTLLSAR